MCCNVPAPVAGEGKWAEKAPSGWGSASFPPPTFWVPVSGGGVLSQAVLVSTRRPPRPCSLVQFLSFPDARAQLAGHQGASLARGGEGGVPLAKAPSLDTSPRSAPRHHERSGLCGPVVGYSPGRGGDLA